MYMAVILRGRGAAAVCSAATRMVAAGVVTAGANGQVVVTYSLLAAIGLGSVSNATIITGGTATFAHWSATGEYLVLRT